MTKRLFIFAGYDAEGIVDKTLTYYLKTLSNMGDIVFIMDNDLSADELKKITDIPNMLYASATRHGEYDFGSYKRGYIWARDNKILKQYDWVYLVNDSVLGPLFNIVPLIHDLESSGVDLTGMASSVIPTLPRHIQSWFVGLSAKVVSEKFFEDFLCNVKAQKSKGLIVLKYEVRLSQIVVQHGYKMCAVFDDADATIYTKPTNLLAKGFPFLKKASEYDINKIDFLYPYADENVIDNIIKYIKEKKLFTNLKNTKYKKICRFTVFGLPIFTIFVRNKSYKLYLFDFIPLCKFMRP